jgi:RsiW-degrading membrane proteinase PrsW (M82 family)
MSLGVLLLLIILFAGIVGVWLKQGMIDWKIYIRNVFIFIAVFFCITLIFTLLSTVFTSFPQLNTEVEGVSLGYLIFNSVKLVIFYYFLIAILEETSKHFHFLTTGIFSVKEVKIGVLYAIFVALGFSFIENILYLYDLYTKVGFGMELVRVYFFRSTFALIVHVLCSTVLAYFFTTAYLREKTIFTFRYLRIFV